jgi:hypothetical protein
MFTLHSRGDMYPSLRSGLQKKAECMLLIAECRWPRAPIKMGVRVNTRYNYFPLKKIAETWLRYELLFLLLLGSLFLCRHRVPP